MNNTIHFILQGKGGVGKSFTAAMLAQFFKRQDANLRAFDTDQVNTTLGAYKGLNAQLVPVTDESQNILPKKFDTLMEALVSEEGTFVIDNGANSFLPISAYMIENEVFDLLAEHGKKVYIHTVVAGGAELRDTSNGFKSIIDSIDGLPVVLWLNAHFGALEGEGGKPFTETKVFQTYQDRIHGLVYLQARNAQTYGDDIRKMTTKRMTVDETLASDAFSLMEKQRIRNVAKDVFGQLEKIEF